MEMKTENQAVIELVKELHAPEIIELTDPSGQILLSTDPVGSRQIHIDAQGVITGVSGAGNHNTSTNTVDGGVTVQLCPFTLSPNPGCVHKVWVTPVEDFTIGSGRHGFLNSRSKTDNFRVCEEVKRIAAERPRSLLETLAEEIAQRILEKFAVCGVAVELRKYILPDTRWVAVRLRRPE